MCRSARILALVSLLSSLSAFAQVSGRISTAVPGAIPSYSQSKPVKVSSLPESYSIDSLMFDAKSGALISGGAGHASITGNANTILNEATTGNDDFFSIGTPVPNKSTIDGLDTLATFDGAFVAQAGPSAGGDFRFTMIGNDPRVGRTTVYSANLLEVSFQLLNADGSVFQTVNYSPFEHLTLESPNFEPLTYASGYQLEYADAVQRAEFYHVMNPSWHTLLIPKVVDKITIQVPFFVNVQLQNGNIVQARSYFTGTAADGSTFVLMLSPLFNLFFDNAAVNEINLGNFTKNGVNIALFPNTFTFSLNANNPNVPGGCCTLGSHTYFETGTFPQLRWVTIAASWISPGIFGGGFQDVTALSKEISEAFGDPFVDNPTPNWQFPGQPANSKVCQANLEVGDPTEVLPNATTTKEVKEFGFDFIYHPENVALYQWFEMGTTSSAVNGSWSFQDHILTQSALPCPQ